MCLGGSRLVTALQAGKDAVLLLQGLRGSSLDLHHIHFGDVGFRRNDIKIKILPENDNAGSLRCVITGVQSMRVAIV